MGCPGDSGFWSPQAVLWEDPSGGERQAPGGTRVRAQRTVGTQRADDCGRLPRRLAGSGGSSTSAVDRIDLRTAHRLDVLPTIGRVPVARLQPAQLDRLYAGLLAKELSRTTVQHVHSILRRALKQAARRHRCPEPDRSGHFPGRDHPEMRVLSAEQARALLAAARLPRHARFEAMYVLAVTTGMRRGELFALRWVDVDLPGRALTVSGTFIRIRRPGQRSSLERTPPKTKTSMRRVPLTSTAVEALQRHQRRQDQETAYFGSDWVDSGTLFCNERGRPLEPSNFLQRSFGPLLEDAGVPHVRFHDLRHTAATLMAAQGMHTKVVSESLGQPGSESRSTSTPTSRRPWANRRSVQWKPSSLLKGHDDVEKRNPHGGCCPRLQGTSSGGRREHARRCSDAEAARLASRQPLPELFAGAQASQLPVRHRR